MKHLLDNDWVVDYLQGKDAAQQLIDPLLPLGAAISILTYSEIYQGILGSYDPAFGKRVVRRFLRGVTVLGVTRGVAEANSAIRLELDRLRTPYKHRALDLLIAATAIHYNLTLVTRNRKDFHDVPGLSIHYGQ
jgi:tRNA(fMet)-specific endonuclease VapC